MREGEDERTDKPSSVDCVPFGFSAQARAEHGAGVLLGAVQGDGEGQEYDQPRDHRTKVAMHGSPPAVAPALWRIRATKFNRDRIPAVSPGRRDPGEPAAALAERDGSVEEIAAVGVAVAER